MVRTNLLVLSFLILVISGMNESFAQDENIDRSPGAQEKVCAPDSNSKDVKVDRFIAPDKAKHFLASAISTVFVFELAHQSAGWNRGRSRGAALGFSVGLGLSKELWDQSRRQHHFSWKDLVADLAGITAGMIIINQR